MFRSACVCHPGEQCELECLHDKVELAPAPDRIPYLLAELRCAAMRARVMAGDIDAVGLALEAGLVEPEQALELLADCECLHLVAPPRGGEHGG